MKDQVRLCKIEETVKRAIYNYEYDSMETCMKQYQQFNMAHNCEDLLANMYKSFATFFSTHFIKYEHKY